MSFGNSLFQYLDTFRIGQAHEVFFQDTLQTFNQSLIKHVIEELHIVGTVVQSPLHTILDEVFRQVHIVRNIIERHFRSIIQNSAKWRGVLEFSARNVGPNV